MDAAPFFSFGGTSSDQKTATPFSFGSASAATPFSFGTPSKNEGGEALPPPPPVAFTPPVKVKADGFASGTPNTVASLPATPPFALPSPSPFSSSIFGGDPLGGFDAASFSLGLPSPPAGTAAENDDEKAAEGDAAPTGKGQQQHIAPLNISAEMAVH